MHLTPQTLSDRLLSELGLVVVQNSAVDGFVQEFLSYLLRANPTSMYVVTQDVAASTVTKWARILATDYLREPSRQEALDLLSLADELRAERNALAHGIWKAGGEPLTAEVQTVRLDRPEMIRTDLVTLADLRQLNADLLDAHQRFAALAARLGFAQG